MCVCVCVWLERKRADVPEHTRKTTITISSRGGISRGENKYVKKKRERKKNEQKGEKKRKRVDGLELNCWHWL